MYTKFSINELLYAIMRLQLQTLTDHIDHTKLKTHLFALCFND